jgi:hypothetical protein
LKQRSITEVNRCRYREQLTKEIEQAPEALLEEILDFCLFIKQRKAKEQLKEAKTQATES